MALKLLPDQAVLLQLLRYDRRTGKLFWRRRDLTMFKAGVRRNNACSSWNSHYAGTEAFTYINPKGYCFGCFLGGRYLAHRIIWKMVHGEEPGPEIDHRNGNRADNRPRNLASGDKFANQKNAFRRRDNTSGRTGVYLIRGKWQAAIFENKRLNWLGTFTAFEDAVAVREAAERRLGYSPRHGEKRNA